MAKRRSKRGPGWPKGRRRMEPIVVAEEAAQYGIKPPASRPPSERFISPNEAGRILNVTGEAVKQWIYRRRLPATKLSNGYWKIKVGDLEDFIRARQSYSQKRLLLVGLAQSDAAELGKAVGVLGHQAVVAHNREDALLKAQDLFPSLFILNATAKDLDTWKLLERIRRSRNIKNAPVLLLADHDLKDAESDRALHLGVQGLIKRPFKIETLVDEIRKVLGRIL
jgi:CheY-like chemotaxis protein